MTRHSSPDGLSLPASLTRDSALDLLDDLVRWWEAAFGPLQDSESDLDAARRFFDPVATGRRLRAALDRVEAVEPPRGPVPSSLAVPLPGERWLVTPDGRLAIDVLAAALSGVADPVAVEPLLVIAAERRLLELYRGWSRHRLNQVIALQTGSERPLQVGPIALGLLLLVNRCTSADAALPCGPDDANRQIIDQAVFKPVREFERTFQRLHKPTFGGEDVRATEKESLAGGWMPGELYRRFPFALREPRKNEPQLLWVRTDGAERLLGSLAAELARRTGGATDVVEEAFDRLVESLRANGPLLAAHGLLHERSVDTLQLRRRLVDLVRQA